METPSPPFPTVLVQVLRTPSATYFLILLNSPLASGDKFGDTNKKVLPHPLTRDCLFCFVPRCVAFSRLPLHVLFPGVTSKKQLVFDSWGE